MIKSLSFIAINGLVLALTLSIASAAPVLGIDKHWHASLRLNACQDGDSFVIFNDGDYVLGWTLTTNQGWFNVEPSTGANLPGLANGTVVTISVDRTGLAPGQYSGVIHFTTNIPQTHDEQVVMYVQETPLLKVGPSTLSFSVEVPDRTLSIRNKGRQTLNWMVSSYPPWINIAPSSAGSLECETQAQLSIHLDLAGLPSQEEEQTGAIIVDSNGGTSTVPVYYFPASQIGGLIGLFADPQGTNCNFLYGGPGLLAVYVVHTRTVGATASQFSAPIPACWTNALWLSDTGIWPINIGNSQTGVALGYGTCQVGPMHIYTINYFVQGPPAGTCCYYPVLPDPHVASGEIEVVDCNGNSVYGEGGTASLYPTANCMCEGGTVRVEETTWGRVKALYAPEVRE